MIPKLTVTIYSFLFLLKTILYLNEYRLLVWKQDIIITTGQLDIQFVITLTQLQE